MKYSTSIKTLPVMAALLLAGGQQAGAAKVSASYGNLAISKVFFNGDKRTDGNTPKNVLLSNYIEIINNSATDEVKLGGLMIGLTDTENPSSNGWTLANLASNGYTTLRDDGSYQGKIALKQVFQIPTTETRTLLPGETLILCNSAQDYTGVLEHGVDLSKADYEVKSENTPNQMSGTGTHNDAVPELNCIFTFTENVNYLNYSYSGPCGVVILQANTNIDGAERVYRPGKESGQQYVLVDDYKIVDAMEILKNGQTAADKRISSYDSYDQGFAEVPAGTGMYGGVTAYRKTAWKKGDVIRVFDTNNSSVDVAFSTDIKPREFPEAVGLSEGMTITIPATGFAVINPEKHFAAAEEGLTLVNINSSTNASVTDLVYYTYPADSVLFMPGPWIVVGAPGEHKLLYSESQGVLKSRTSVMEWTDEAQVDFSTTNKKSRYMYKFVSTTEKTGFQRDETYAADAYPYAKCDFAEGEHIFFAVATKNLDKIAAANDATDHTDLSFIKWHGPVYKSSDTSTIIEDIKANDARVAGIYNLQGQQVAAPVKGLYIVNGKKVIK